MKQSTHTQENIGGTARHSHEARRAAKRSTRFNGLYYGRIAVSLWRFIVEGDDGTTHAVGPYYHTRDELLADTERYAHAYGYK